MAPLPVIDQTFRVALEWKNSDTGLEATNVMHFHAPGKTNGQVAAALEAHVNSSLWFNQGTHSAITQVNITPLDGTSTTLPYTPITAANWTGYSTPNDMSPQICGIVKFITAKRGRSYRGRLFLPWVVEARQTNGKFDATDNAAVTAAWRAFFVAMVADGVKPTVASYVHSTQQEVLVVTHELYTATQRRRAVRNSQ